MSVNGSSSGNTDVNSGVLGLCEAAIKWIAVTALEFREDQGRYDSKSPPKDISNPIDVCKSTRCFCEVQVQVYSGDVVPSCQQP